MRDFIVGGHVRRTKVSGGWLDLNRSTVREEMILRTSPTLATLVRDIDPRSYGADTDLRGIICGGHCRLRVKRVLFVVRVIIGVHGMSRRVGSAGKVGLVWRNEVVIRFGVDGGRVEQFDVRVEYFCHDSTGSDSDGRESLARRLWQQRVKVQGQRRQDRQGKIKSVSQQSGNAVRTVHVLEPLLWSHRLTSCTEQELVGSDALQSECPLARSGLAI